MGVVNGTNETPNGAANMLNNPNSKQPTQELTIGALLAAIDQLEAGGANTVMEISNALDDTDIHVVVTLRPRSIGGSAPVVYVFTAPHGYRRALNHADIRARLLEYVNHGGLTFGTPIKLETNPRYRLKIVALYMNTVLLETVTK